jgi:hypothetical protein
MEGSILIGRSNVGDGSSASVDVFRVRLTRRFPRASRLEPFIGAAVVMSIAHLYNQTTVEPGLVAEPGVIWKLGAVRPFAQAVVGYIVAQDVIRQDGAYKAPTGGLFAGILIGAQLGWSL